MKTLLGFFFLLFSLLTVGPVNAGQEALSVFQKANAAYRGGDYAQATSLYESLTSKGPRDVSVYYNLGNAYFKQERLGLAILNYEKAKRVSPRDRDIRANLNYVRGLLEYRMEDKRNWYLRTLEAVLGAFTFKEIGIVGLTLGILFWISWTFSLSFRPEEAWGWRRKTLLALTLCTLCLWFLKGVQEKRVQEAIVLKPQAAVRYGPSYKDQIALKLGEGMKVLVKKRQGEWSRVVLINGETGWMPQEDLGVI